MQLVEAGSGQGRDLLRGQWKGYSLSVGLRVVGPITGFSRASLVLRTAALQQGKAEGSPGSEPGPHTLVSNSSHLQRGLCRVWGGAIP